MLFLFLVYKVTVDAAGLNWMHSVILAFCRDLMSLEPLLNFKASDWSGIKNLKLSMGKLEPWYL